MFDADHFGGIVLARFGLWIMIGEIELLVKVM